MRDGFVSLAPRILPTIRHGEPCTDRRYGEESESPNRKTQRTLVENELEEDGRMRIAVEEGVAEKISQESGRFTKKEQANLGNVIHGWSVPDLPDVGFI